MAAKDAKTSFGLPFRFFRGKAAAIEICWTTPPPALEWWGELGQGGWHHVRR